MARGIRIDGSKIETADNSVRFAVASLQKRPLSVKKPPAKENLARLIQHYIENHRVHSLETHARGIEPVIVG